MGMVGLVALEAIDIGVVPSMPIREWPKGDLVVSIVRVVRVGKGRVASI